MGSTDVVAEVRRALRADPRIAGSGPIEVRLEADALLLEGEVASVAAKKLALERAAALAPGVRGLVDRVHVTPAQAMGDGAIRDHVASALAEEPALGGIGVRSGGLDGTAEPLMPCIAISVEGGIVTLAGEVPSLSHKRLAGVLAWWVPGSRDVVNGLEVVPPEEDSDAEVVDALRIVLERDPLVDASSILVRSEGFVVRLSGVVRSEPEREAAELDAWCLFGVDRVDNALTIARV